MDFEKSINSFEIKKRIRYLIIHWKIIFFLPIFNNFSARLLYNINFLAIIANMFVFFQIFILTRSTEISIE